MYVLDFVEYNVLKLNIRNKELFFLLDCTRSQRRWELSMFGFGTSTKREASNDYDMSNHASDMLKAASPYLSSDLQKSLNLFVKTFEFMNVLKDINSPKQKAEYFHEQSKIDFEGLLKSVRPHCTKEEGELIDIFINMMSAMNFYKTYQEMASMFATSQEATAEQEYAEGTESDNFDSSSFGAQSASSSTINPDMFSTLVELLPPEQKGTFEMLKTMMESGMLNQMFT